MADIQRTDRNRQLGLLTVFSAAALAILLIAVLLVGLVGLLLVGRRRRA